MNCASSKARLKESPKLPQIRLVFEHNDQQSLEPAQSLQTLKNPQLKQRRHGLVLVSNDDSARFTHGRMRVPFQDSLADLFVNLTNCWVETSESEVPPGERGEVDIEFHPC